MRITVQHSKQAYAMNAVRTYGNGRSAAIVLMGSNDQEVQLNLGRALGLHDAPTVDLESGAPWQLDSVGDCQIRSDGIQLTMRGNGGSFMGMRFVTSWGLTSPVWRRHAEESGCAWLGIPGIAEYDSIQKAVASESPVLLPPMPVLRLDLVS